MRIVFHILWVLAIAAATWLAGWWSVVLVAAAAGVVYRQNGGRAGLMALAGAEAWILLLLFDLSAGPFGQLGGLLQRVMTIPWPALVLVTLAFPAAMAWSAATMTGELARAATTRTAATSRSRR